MNIKYLGHSAFMIEGGGIKALIDPFISQNPGSGIDVNELKGITHVFVTHGHNDHLGDTQSIAIKNNAKVICNYEIGQYLSTKGLLVHTMHIGGRTSFDFGKVKMIHALHGSSIFDKGNIIYGGNPCGFLIELEGKKIYHAGDTGLTMDMKLLEEENIDVALLPIGGNFTMDIYDAVKAVDFIKPKMVIPMHYNTFPLIRADAEEFKEKITKATVRILSVGESISL